MINDTPHTHIHLTREARLIESTFKLWWARRKFIAIVMTSLIALFAVILLLIPALYRAQASVIIMPPRFVPEVRTVPLAVPTAQSLLETQELYQQVLNTIKRDRALVIKLAGTDSPTDEAVSKVAALSASDISSTVQTGEGEADTIANLDETEIAGLLEFDEDELANLNADSIGEMFSSEESVEKKTASELVYSPVLQLYAVSDSGNKAQALVNIWARLFEKKYEAINRGQTQRLYASLENQQGAGQQELEKIQKTIVDFKLANNLDLIQRQIRDKSETFSSFSQQMIGRTNEYNTLQAKLGAMLQLTDALEVPGYGWVGSALLDEFTSTTDASTLHFAAPSDKDDILATVSLFRREAINSRQNLIKALNTAATFNAENPVALLTSEDERMRREFVEQQSQLRTSLVDAQVLEQSLKELDHEIENTSQALSLQTALPNEVVGNALASNQDRQIQRAASLQLNTERVNPAWTELIKRRSSIVKNLARAKATAAELGAIIPAKSKEVVKATTRAFKADQGSTIIQKQILRFTGINNTLFSGYSEMKQDLFATSLRMTLLEPEINTMAQTIESLHSEIDRLRESYEAAAAELEVLNLRKTAVEKRAELVTQKLQESLVAVGEQVSDVSLASKAVAPARHFFPPRAILLVIMTIIAGVILLGGMSRRRYLELLAAAGQVH